MKAFRELIILRHGKTDRKIEVSDFERPLSDKGKKTITKVQHWLHAHKLMPDLILTASSKRAQQTLKRICPNGKINSLTLDTLYHAPLNDLLQVLAQAPQAQTVMLIGNNPGLQDLITHLSQTKKEAQQPHPTRLFPTGGFAHFILPQDWTHLEAGSGKLIQLIRPQEIHLPADK